MQFSAILLPMAFSLAAAQYGSTDDSSSSVTPSVTSSAAPTTFTSTSGVVTHKVAVGKNGLSFTPDTITAAAGDAIEFHFYPNTHSVSQSTFAAPCAPANASSFFSGKFTTAAGSVNATTFTVMLNNTNPIWLYCGYPSHCQSGMVAVINPPSSTAKTLKLYAAAAAGTSDTTVPAQVQGGVKGPAAQIQGSSTTASSPSGSASTTGKPNDAGALKATMGVFAGLLSLAFAGLIM